MTYTIEIELSGITDDLGLPMAPVTDLFEVEVEADVTPGRPGNYFGLPENCYPDEPAEVEFDVTDDDIAAQALTFYAAQLESAGIHITAEQRKEFSAAVSRIAAKNLELLWDTAIEDAAEDCREAPDYD